jgi:hypothetical protein
MFEAMCRRTKKGRPKWSAFIVFNGGQAPVYGVLIRFFLALRPRLLAGRLP